MLESFFSSFPLWFLLVTIVASILVLGVSADKMVDGAASLAHYTGLSPLIIGATIVSLGTTVPEMVVSVFAAFYGDSSLALGNAVGSIIVDTALILAIIVCLGRVVLEPRSISAASWWRDLCTTGLVLFAWFLPDHILPRWLGFLGLGLLVVYIFQTYWRQIRTKEEENPQLTEVEEAVKKIPHLSLPLSLIYLIIGLILVVISSRLLLPQVKLFATRMGIPQDIIATTLVAFGTSLPELTTAFASIRKKEESLGVGNIMGADLLNCLFVVGAAAATKAIHVEPAFFYLHFPVMLVILWSLRFIFLAQRRQKHWVIPKWYGFLLLLSYIAYVVLQYTLGIPQV